MAKKKSEDVTIGKDNITANDILIKQKSIKKGTEFNLNLKQKKIIQDEINRITIGAMIIEKIKILSKFSIFLIIKLLRYHIFNY